MDDSPHPNPLSGFRTLYLSGFLSGNVCGLWYLAFTGHLPELVSLNPLAFLGVFFLLGLVGMQLGALCGLVFRLCLEKLKAKDRWRSTVIVATTVSGAFGLLIAYVVVRELY